MPNESSDVREALPLRSRSLHRVRCRKASRQYLSAVFTEGLSEATPSYERRQPVLADEEPREYPNVSDEQ